MTDEIWTGVDRLIDQAPGLAGLRAHRLHLLAAKRWRHLGRGIPDELSREETVAAAVSVTATQVLSRVRAAYDGQLVLLKGPEIADRYPAPNARSFVDLDILAEDPDQAQKALLAAGFKACGKEDNYYDGLHHLRPLYYPTYPVPLVEIHRRPNWVEWGDSPEAAELFEAAVPATSAPGLLALPAAHHSLVIAAHSWIELPLRRLSDLVDFLAVGIAADQREVEELAIRWKIDRVWNTTRAAAEALILGEGDPLSLRLWARNLRAVRDRTVLQEHVRRSASPFWALPARRAVVESARSLVRDATPTPPETWASKLRRTRQAILNPSRPATEHRRQLGGEAYKSRLRRR